MPKLLPRELREVFVRYMCEGETIRSAAARAGVSKSGAWQWWGECGHMELTLRVGTRGIGPWPADLPEEGRTRRPLSIDDRVGIAAGVKQGASAQEIGEDIGRDKTTVWREVRRNISPDGAYRAAIAHRAAARRRSRPKPMKLSLHPGLCCQIEAWMDDGWSPKLISDVLARDSDTVTVSHETIYQNLYVQTRGSLRADLHRCLSLGRSRRQTRARGRRDPSPYKEAFKISERPAEVDDRAVPGHWEGDLIMGGTASNSAIGTLVERTSRFTILLHLPDGHNSAAVAEAMIREMRKLPEHLRRSITWDRGRELAKYAEIQLALDADLYFCDPHSPWQRGTNENTNRLLRHWFKKGSDLSTHSAEDLAKVAGTLNSRPRPTLNLATPADKLNELLLTAAT